VRAFLDGACEGRGSAPFLVFRDRMWSYADTGVITDALAAELLALGIAPGDRLAVHLPNGPEHLFLWLATAKAGIVSCPLHVDLAAPEIEAALLHLAPRAFVDASGTISIRGCVVAPLTELMASRRALTGASAPKPEAIATILTTSGTTGKPKAAMLSHRMAVLSGEGFGHWLRLTADDRLFTCLPLSHVNARFYSTLGAIAVGASLALEERFSASRFWSSVRASGATEANAIGAMLKILLDRKPTADESAHKLRLVYAAPALGRDPHLSFERRFHTRLVIGYGLTESTFGFIQKLDDARDLDSMGHPRRHPDPEIPAEVRLVDGEVWLRNPATFSGYFEDDAATLETSTADGWLKTGDLARCGVDGSYTFVGRKKLVIRRRGELLTPGEVEAAIEAHPAVLEAGVVGIPSPLGEDDVMAYVVFRDGARASEQELAAFCASRIAAFKVPTRWRVLDVLPRTPTQRVAYHLLK
jgi:crotonobetaine/carnitine-CoA ligase